MQVHSIKKLLTMHTNAWASLSYQKGMLGNLMFWSNVHGIANVVLLRTLEMHFHVTYGSTKGENAE